MHVLGADRLAPGERPARVVEPEDHARRRRPRGEPTPSPTAKHASLTSWATMRPSTSPGASPTHAVRRPSAAKNASVRSAATGAVPALRVSSTSGAPLERRQHVEAHGAAAGVERVQRAVGAQQRDAGRPAAAGPRGRRPHRSAATGPRPRPRPGRARRSRRAPPGPRSSWATASSPATATSRPSPPPAGAGGAGSSAGSRGYSYQPRPVLRPRRPAATMRALSGEGRQRGSPKLSSWKESETS